MRMTEETNYPDAKEYYPKGIKCRYCGKFCYGIIAGGGPLQICNSCAVPMKYSADGEFIQDADGSVALSPKDLMEFLTNPSIQKTEAEHFAAKEIVQLQAKLERLKEGIRLYIILRAKEQFAPPDVFVDISKFTGKEYKAGHLISCIRNDLEQELSGK